MKWMSRGQSTDEGLHNTKTFPTGGLHDTKKFSPSGSLVRIVNLGYIVHIGVFKLIFFFFKWDISSFWPSSLCCRLDGSGGCRW
jgi:hypothetical protein